jgi:hypothetical protein
MCQHVWSTPENEGRIIEKVAVRGGVRKRGRPKKGASCNS